MSMKMVMLVYNEAIEKEVFDAATQSGAVNFTKITRSLGRGGTSGIHDGTDIWPGLNTTVFMACPAEVAARLMNAVRELRPRLGSEGVKAFAWSLDDVT